MGTAETLARRPRADVKVVRYFMVEVVSVRERQLDVAIGGWDVMSLRDPVDGAALTGIYVLRATYHDSLLPASSPCSWRRIRVTGILGQPGYAYIIGS
jgi:hypothetical protein